MINIGSILPVGTIIHSMLSTAQFATEYGDNWVLADGRSVTGTKYALVTGLTTLPDMRGRFLRGKNNGSVDGSKNNESGDLDLGTFEIDRFKSHAHQQTYSNDGFNKIPATVSNGGSGFNLTFNSISGATHSSVPNTGNNPQSQSTLLAGGTAYETAPKAVTVNIFIRIN